MIPARNLHLSLATLLAAALAAGAALGCGGPGAKRDFPDPVLKRLVSVQVCSLGFSFRVISFRVVRISRANLGNRHGHPT